MMFGSLVYSVHFDLRYFQLMLGILGQNPIISSATSVLCMCIIYKFMSSVYEDIL